jgi:homoserine kinase type II
MDQVYLLHHVRSDDEFEDDAKLIGVYKTDAAARAAIARLGKQPGFRDHPNGFQINAYELDEDHWTEGFVTGIHAGMQKP